MLNASATTKARLFVTAYFPCNLNVFPLWKMKQVLFHHMLESEMFYWPWTLVQFCTVPVPTIDWISGWHVRCSMHQLDAHSLMKRPTNVLWIYECNFTTQLPSTCFGHSCGHLHGGKRLVLPFSRNFKQKYVVHWLLKTNKCTTMYCVYSKTCIKTLKKLLHVSIYRSSSGSARSSLLKLC
jgi:hypothetical protein